MTSAIWRCRTTQALISWICLVKGKWRQKHVLTCFFFLLTGANFEWMIKQLLDLAFVRCEESCRSLRRLLVDNTLLDLHYFSDSTQPYPRIAKIMLNLQSPSKLLGRLPFLPLLFLPPPAPGPMLIKTLMFVCVIVLLYPNIE